MPQTGPLDFKDRSSDPTAPAASITKLFGKAAGLFTRRNGEAAKRLLTDADIDHDHDGSPTQKLAQANTHESADTDSGTTALHHTLGTGANQAAAGNHTHGSGPGGAVPGEMVLFLGEASQSISSSTETTVAWDTEHSDPHGLHSGGVITLPTGLYTVHLDVAWEDGTTGRRNIGFRFFFGLEEIFVTSDSSAAMNSLRQSCSNGFIVPEGDPLTYDARVWHNQGGARLIGTRLDGDFAAAQGTTLTIVYNGGGS